MPFALFLISNRHVIKDEQKSYIPYTVRLSLHANPDDLRENHNYDIPLYDGMKPRWIQPNPFADVVAIPIDAKDIERQDLLIKSFSDIEFPNKVAS